MASSSSASAAAATAASTSDGGTTPVHFVTATLDDYDDIGDIVRSSTAADQDLAMSDHDRQVIGAMKRKYAMSDSDYLLPKAHLPTVYPERAIVEKVTDNKRDSPKVRDNRVIALMDALLLERHWYAVRKSEEWIREELQPLYEEGQRALERVAPLRIREGLETTSQLRDPPGESNTAKVRTNTLIEYYRHDRKRLRRYVDAVKDDRAKVAEAKQQFREIWVDDHVLLLMSIFDLAGHAHHTYIYYFQTRVESWLKQRMESARLVNSGHAPFLTTHELLAFRIEHDYVMTSVAISPNAHDYGDPIRGNHENGYMLRASVAHTYARAIANSPHLKRLVLAVPEGVNSRAAVYEPLFSKVMEDAGEYIEPEERAESERRAQSNEHVVRTFTSASLHQMFIPFARAISENRSLEQVDITSMYAFAGLSLYFVGTAIVDLFTGVSVLGARRNLITALRNRTHADGSPNPLVIMDAVSDVEKHHARRVFQSVGKTQSRKYDLSTLLTLSPASRAHEDRVVKQAHDFLHSNVDDAPERELLSAMLNNIADQSIDTSENAGYYGVNVVGERRLQLGVNEQLFDALYAVIRGFEFRDAELEKRAGAQITALMLSASERFENSFGSVEATVLRAVENRGRPLRGFITNMAFMSGAQKMVSLAFNDSIRYLDVGSLHALGGFATYDGYGFRLPLNVVDDFHDKFTSYLANRGRAGSQLREVRIRSPMATLRVAQLRNPWIHLSHAAVALLENRNVDKVSFVGGGSYAFESLPDAASRAKRNIQNLLRFDDARRFKYFEFHCVVEDDEDVDELDELRRLIVARSRMDMLRLLVRMEVFDKNVLFSFLMDMASHASLRHVHIMFVVPSTVHVTSPSEIGGGGDDWHRKIHDDMMQLKNDQLQFIDIGYYRIVDRDDRGNGIRFPKRAVPIEHYRFSYPKLSDGEQREHARVQSMQQFDMTEKVFPFAS